MGQRSFIIKVIIGSILIGIAVAANYCQLCENHVACRPKRGFGVRCGNRRAIVPLKVSQQKQILQIHDGLRSLVASGLVTGYAPAKRMGHMQWDAELAKIAALNARQCYVHYDNCKKTAKFPWAGQNVGIDRESGRYRATNQSIYRITLKWFRQFELANATVMNSYRAAKNPKKRYRDFATMIHDRQTRIGCAAVRFRYKQFYYLYLVCNYSVGALQNRKIYIPGTPYTGCVAGRSMDYPSLCAKNEPIKSVPYAIARAQKPGVTRQVNPLSYFGIQSPTNSLQQLPNNIQQRPNNFVMPSNRFQPPLNSYGVVNLNQEQTGRKKTKPKHKRIKIRSKGRKKSQKKARENNRRTQRNSRAARVNKRNRSNSKNSRRKTNERNQTQIPSQPQQMMFPNPFIFYFG